MRNLKAMIVDDEKAARNVLSNLLALSHPDIEVVATCANLPDAIPLMKAESPDLVFLDVELPQYAGYEIVNFLDEIPFQIIFVTAYDKYAVKAFELNAADYLVKPIQRSRLKAAIERVQQRFREQAQLVDYQAVLSELEAKHSPTLTISETGMQFMVKTVDIVAVQGQGSYSEITLKSGERKMVSKNIGVLEKELRVDPRFFRTHKSWIVNLREIVALQRSKEILVLEGGVHAKLSRFKKEAFEQAIERLGQGGLG